MDSESVAAAVGMATGGETTTERARRARLLADVVRSITEGSIIEQLREEAEELGRRLIYAAKGCSRILADPNLYNDMEGMVALLRPHREQTQREVEEILRRCFSTDDEPQTMHARAVDAIIRRAAEIMGFVKEADPANDRAEQANAQGADLIERVTKANDPAAACETDTMRA